MNELLKQIGLAATKLKFSANAVPKRSPNREFGFFPAPEGFTTEVTEFTKKSLCGLRVLCGETSLGWGLSSRQDEKIGIRGI